MKYNITKCKTVLYSRREFKYLIKENKFLSANMYVLPNKFTFSNLLFSHYKLFLIFSKTEITKTIGDFNLK